MRPSDVVLYHMYISGNSSVLRDATLHSLPIQQVENFIALA